MRVIRLVLHAQTRQPVLVLGEAEGKRCLPVFLRQPQADVIAIGPRGEQDPLLPQDVLIPILRGLGHTLDGAEITGLTDGVFSAELVFDGDKRIPVLPSDALAVAVRERLPIAVADTILDEVGQPVEDLFPDGTDAPPEQQLEEFRIVPGRGVTRRLQHSAGALSRRPREPPRPRPRRGTPPRPAPAPPGRRSTRRPAPAIGPPIGVDPRNATAQSAITRPRICGSAASCSVLLPVERNATLDAPTSAIPTSATGRFGAAAVPSMASPNRPDATTSAGMPVRPHPATYSPPTTAPRPIAAVRKP